MKKRLLGITSVVLCMTFGLAAQELVNSVDGTLKTINRKAKTLVVDGSDGVEHTFHYAGDLTVHGVSAADKASDSTFHGLQEGEKVAVHYTTMKSKDTAHEIDNIDSDGLKEVKGKVAHIDRKSKRIAIKTDDGSEETFRLTDRAATDTTRDVAENAKKSGDVTVYYTEKAGKKTVHFIKGSF